HAFFFFDAPSTASPQAWRSFFSGFFRSSSSIRPSSSTSSSSSTAAASLGGYAAAKKEGRTPVASTPSPSSLTASGTKPPRRSLRATPVAESL
ncbi:hypothetical protein PENTCL1PPCAC_9681, partial [Pristionchus entomophagus]